MEVKVNIFLKVFVLALERDELPLS